MTTDYLGWGGSAYRVGLIECTHTTYGGGGTMNGFDTTAFQGRAVDGSFTASSSGSWFWPSTSLNGTQAIRFDFKAPVVVKKVKWYQDTAGTSGVHQFQGSNDGSSWTSIGSPIAAFGVASGTSIEYDFSADNSTAYRYYRFLGQSGSTNAGPWQTETEFQTDHGPLEAGDRTASITVNISGFTLAGGTANNLVDGSLANDDSGAIRLTEPASVTSSFIIELDFNGTTIPINAIGVMCLDSGIDPFGGQNDDGIWQAQAYVSGAWQNFGSSFTMAAVATHVQTDTQVFATKMRYIGVSGATDDAVRINEIFFNSQGVVPPDTTVHPVTVVNI